MPNTRDLCRELIKLGGTVKKPDKTGELECSHPSSGKKVRIQHWTRRKSAPRALVVLLKKARKA